LWSGGQKIAAGVSGIWEGEGRPSRLDLTASALAGARQKRKCKKKNEGASFHSGFLSHKEFDCLFPALGCFRKRSRIDGRRLTFLVRKSYDLRELASLQSLQDHPTYDGSLIGCIHLGADLALDSLGGRSLEKNHLLTGTILPGGHKHLHGRSVQKRGESKPNKRFPFMNRYDLQL